MSVGLRAARACAPPGTTPLFARSIRQFGSSSRSSFPLPSSFSSSSSSPFTSSLFANARAALLRRGVHGSAVGAQRQALGRIIPRRIAIPVTEGMTGSGGLPKPSIWRPIVFCLTTSALVYCYAAAETNSETDYWVQRVASGRWIVPTTPSDEQLWKARKIALTAEAQARVNRLPQVLSFLPDFLFQPALRLSVMWEESSINRPMSYVPAVTLIGVFGGVFAAWKTKSLQPFMTKWFLHRPVILGGGARAEWANCVTMLTSVFSHKEFTHLAFNSIALYSFGATTYQYLVRGKDGEYNQLNTANPALHFIAFFVAAGLASSLGSHLWTNIVRLPRLLRTLQSPARLSSAQALAAHQAILPSLGASGAIYACVTMSALAFPDVSVSLIFLPFVAFPITWGVGAMVLVDIVGVFRGWKMFNHIAHLGGAAFGVLYYGYGRPFFEWLRIRLGAKPRHVAPRAQA